jgi:glycosyltransferase involved in cell wall biosynthesis
MKGATGVITPNEFMQREVLRRHGVAAVVIRNACDLAPYEALARQRETTLKQAKGDDGEVRIVYTGGVGALHFHAFRNLLAAIGSLGRKDVKLHLYAPQPQTVIEAEGIKGPVVYHVHQPVAAMPVVQMEADVLFLPLAFKSGYSADIVRTAAPGKIGEYLAARRPILVHAPADSFVAWYFRHYECGLVVDRDDPEELAGALSRLLSDRELCEQLTTRAWQRACDDFDLPRAQARFASVLGLDAKL